MKTKLGTVMGMSFVVFLAITVIAVIVAVEVFVLKLLGLQYDRWQSLALFLVLQGVIEYVLVIGVKAVIQGRSKHHPFVHLFFGHVIVSFTVIMTLTQWLGTVYMNEYGAAVFAVLSAAIYTLLEKSDMKDNEVNTER